MDNFYSTFLGELIHALELSKPRFIFISPAAAKLTLKVCRKLKFVQQVIVFGGNELNSETILLQDFINNYEIKDFNLENFVARRVSRDQVVYIASSSGTTGMPKGVLITQENIMSVIQGMRDIFTVSKQILGHTIVASSVAPWFHSMGLFTMILNACSRDNIFVFLPKFESEPFLRCIQDYKVSNISVVPPIMVFLAKSPMIDKYDLSSLKSMTR